MDNVTNLSTYNFTNSAFLEDIPFDKIYEFARREASRKKPAFFIHKYFARRITLNFRMMLLGALLSKEDSIFEEIYKSHNSKNLDNVTILDPFMGGATTLFEAIRLGTKVIGCDLQPLSKFVTKALIQDINIDNLRNEFKKLENTISEQIKNYYKTECPKCHKTADVMYCFHVKKVTTNTNCKEHYLYSSFVLSYKNNIFTLICPECGNLFDNNFKENDEIGFYRFFYAKSMTYMLYKFIDSQLLSEEEKIDVLSNMRWFYKLSKELNVPACQESLELIINKIIDGDYKDVIDICKVIAEVRTFMPQEIKEKMSNPQPEMYKKMMEV